jgi:hypothetical protein
METPIYKRLNVQNYYSILDFKPKTPIWHKNCYFTRQLNTTYTAIKIVENRKTGKKLLIVEKDYDIL